MGGRCAGCPDTECEYCGGAMLDDTPPPVDATRELGWRECLERLIGIDVPMPACVVETGKYCAVGADWDMDEGDCEHGEATAQICGDCGGDPTPNPAHHDSGCVKWPALVALEALAQGEPLGAEWDTFEMRDRVYALCGDSAVKPGDVWKLVRDVAAIAAQGEPPTEPRVDALHPSGRCTCGGEGRCAWCGSHCDECGAPAFESVLNHVSGERVNYCPDHDPSRTVEPSPSALERARDAVDAWDEAASPSVTAPYEHPARTRLIGLIAVAIDAAVREERAHGVSAANAAVEAERERAIRGEPRPEPPPSVQERALSACLYHVDSDKAVCGNCEAIATAIQSAVLEERAEGTRRTNAAVREERERWVRATHAHDDDDERQMFGAEVRTAWRLGEDGHSPPDAPHEWEHVGNGHDVCARCGAEGGYAPAACPGD